MPYITSVERIGMEKAMEKGMEKGRKEGLVEAIGMDVVIKFPEEAAEIMELVKAIDDVDALRAALRAVKTANTPAEIRTALGAGVHQSKSS